ncbi:DAR GTPase 3 [Nymphaea thermarum]|nr:DAR GTPase 3 [Nymphaea thermarum]
MAVAQFSASMIPPAGQPNNSLRRRGKKTIFTPFPYSIRCPSAQSARQSVVSAQSATIVQIPGGRSSSWQPMEGGDFNYASLGSQTTNEWANLDADLYQWIKALRPVQVHKTCHILFSSTYGCRLGLNHMILMDSCVLSLLIILCHLRRDHLQWYPGHIAKAEKELKDQLKLMDVVIEVRDARIPMSTSHPQMDSWLGNRRKILVLNREDMISSADRNAWATYFARQGIKVVFANGQLGMGTMKLGRLAKSLALVVNAKRRKKGLLPRPVSLMNF